MSGYLPLLSAVDPAHTALASASADRSTRQITAGGVVVACQASIDELNEGGTGVR